MGRALIVGRNVYCVKRRMPDAADRDSHGTFLIFSVLQILGQSGTGPNGASLVSVRKRPFCPIAALLSRRKMLTYRMYAPLFRLPRALHSNKIARFRMDTSLRNGEQWGQDSKLGAMLRQALNRPCITQGGLARGINTKKSAISRIENHAEDIKLSTLEKFMHALLASSLRISGS